MRGVEFGEVAGGELYYGLGERRPAGEHHSSEIERLVEAMQRHWLLRKYVNKTNPPPLRPLPSPPGGEKKPVTVLRSPKDAAR